MPCSLPPAPKQPAEQPPSSGAPRPRRGVCRLTAPQISINAVMGYMGMPADAPVNGSIDRAVRSAIALVEPVLQPVAMWALPDIVDRTRHSISVALPGCAPVRIPANDRLFRGAEQVLFLLLTLGPEIDKLLAELVNGDELLLSMAVDAAASAAMSDLGRNCRAARRAALARRGLQTGAYYCPGCQAMPLEAQQTIFQVLTPARIGVELTDSCLMRPAKSVTNVAPVAAALPAWMQNLDPCQLCNLRASCSFKTVRG